MINFGDITPFADDPCELPYLMDWTPITAKVVTKLTANKALIVYANYIQDTEECPGPWRPEITAIVAEIEGNEITYGNPVVLFTIPPDEQELSRFEVTIKALNEFYAIVAYRKTTLPSITQEGFVVGVQVFDNVINGGSPFMFDSAPTGWGGGYIEDVAIAPLGGNRFVITYSNFPTEDVLDRGMYARIGNMAVPSMNISWETSPIRLNSDIVNLNRGINDGWPRAISCERLDTERFIVVWQNHYTTTADRELYTSVFTIVGSTLTPSTSTKFKEQGLAITHSRVRKLENDRAMIMWVSRRTTEFPSHYNFEAVITNILGTTPSFGTIHEYFAEDTTRLWQLNFDTFSPSRFVLSFSAKLDGDTIWTMRTTTGTISGNDIVFGDHEEWPNQTVDLGSGVDIVALSPSSFIATADWWTDGLAVAIAAGVPVGNSYAIKHSISKTFADICYATVWADDFLFLDIYDLDSLSLVDAIPISAGSFSQLESKERIVYPYADWIHDGSVYLFGRFRHPVTNEIVHILKTEDFGTTFEVIEDGWGTDHCSALVVDTMGLIYACRSRDDRSTIYLGSDLGMEQRSILPFGSFVNPQGMKLDHEDSSLIIASGKPDSRIIVRASFPFADSDILNITFNHATDAGINAVEIL